MVWWLDDGRGWRAIVHDRLIVGGPLGLPGLGIFWVGLSLIFKLDGLG